VLYRFGLVRHTKYTVTATTIPTTAKTMYAANSSPGVSTVSAGTAPLKSAVGLRLIAAVGTTAGAVAAAGAECAEARAGEMPALPNASVPAHTTNNNAPAHRPSAFVIEPIDASPPWRSTAGPGLQ
jgi:hypothetical protein